MIRGTTPTHVFTLGDFDSSRIKEIRVTYQQRRKTIIEKTQDDATIENNQVIVTLSQEETLKFSTSDYVDVQLKVLLNDGKVLANDIITISADRILNEEILG